MSSLPAEPILRAAGRWARYLQHSSMARANAIFASHPDYIDLTPTQYGAALGWLQQIGLVTGDGALTSSTSQIELAMFQAAVLHSRPLWLRDADQLISNPDDLPDDAISAGEVLGLAPCQTVAAVRAAWGKVDTSARKQIGSAGEAALAALLSELADATVDHVGAYADSLGYDIAVHGNGLHLNLEVKSTTRRGRLTVYLSRNEFEVMGEDSSWRLVVVLLGPDLKVEAVGTVDPKWVGHHAPADSSPFARWESVRLDIPPTAVQGGIAEVHEWAGAQLGEQHLLRTGVGERPPAWITDANVP
jgi:hypothetical protein